MTGASIACRKRRAGNTSSTTSAVCERCACSLCGELDGTQPPLHTLLGVLAPPSRVLLESDNWVVVPTLGPLVPGHIMLVPRRHFSSALACPEPLLGECEDVIDRCVARLRDLYRQPVVMFEHGAGLGAPRSCGACIEHAHLHLLPGPTSFVTTVTSAEPNWISAHTLNELRAELGMSAYMLAGKLDPPDRILFARKPDKKVASQFLRKVFAGTVGNSTTWDWRRFPQPTTLLQTMRDWNS
jgi:diadenosine tetraphosphate (Ap4A) HIT family hydrolase